MTGSRSQDTTQLLKAWADGDEQALEELVPRVHRELRRLAGKLLKNERRGETLQATDLVHEAYVRLIESKGMDWEHRAHFFAVSATVMRRILVDRARKRCAAKRVGKREFIDLDQRLDLASVRSQELIALDDALKTLNAVDERRARIVELRFFGGLDIKETAHIVGLSADTVMRDWKLARAWLLTELDEKVPPAAASPNRSTSISQ
jgi:RNA polymerase sigma factor (TIGR02999 family)